MFGFLITGEVNDDAVRLKTMTDLALSRYLPHTIDELRDLMAHDFTEKEYRIDFHDNVTWTFPDLPMFQFTFDTRRFSGEIERGLTVIGMGKYAGFTLHATSKNWICSVSNGLTYRATGGARKLARLMVKKFDVSNTTWMLMRGR